MRDCESTVLTSRVFDNMMHILFTKLPLGFLLLKGFCLLYTNLVNYRYFSIFTIKKHTKFLFSFLFFLKNLQIIPDEFLSRGTYNLFVFALIFFQKVSNFKK